MPLKRIALTLEFDGTAYGGWQRQKNTRTIQGEVEKALTKLCHEPISLFGCSRTDAGVHARRHVSHFDTRCTIPPERLPLALAALLPSDITCVDAVTVSSDFHARFGCKGKQYSYYILNRRVKSALLARYSCPEARPLDIKAMQEAAVRLIGRHDFKAFQAAGSSAKTTERTLYRVAVTAEGDALIRITVAGDGFLYNMVRIIAGTLLYVGLGKLSSADMDDILAFRNRVRAGKTLPPQGLFLDEVYYTDVCHEPCYNVTNIPFDLIT